MFLFLTVLVWEGGGGVGGRKSNYIVARNPHNRFSMHETE